MTEIRSSIFIVRETARFHDCQLLSKFISFIFFFLFFLSFCTWSLRRMRGVWRDTCGVCLTMCHLRSAGLSGIFWQIEFQKQLAETLLDGEWRHRQLDSYGNFPFYYQVDDCWHVVSRWQNWVCAYNLPITHMLLNEAKGNRSLE